MTLNFKKKILVTTILFIAISFKSFSQNEAYPWTVDIGVNDIDYSHLLGPFSSRIGSDAIINGHHIFAPRIGVSWLAHNRIVFNLSTSLNSLATKINNTSGNRLLYLSIDAEAEYALVNPLRKLVPSVYGGLGYNYIKSSSMLSANAGGILKYWFTSTFGIRLQVGVKKRINKYGGGYEASHSYYAVGVVFPLEIFKRSLKGDRKNSGWRNVNCN